MSEQTPLPTGEQEARAKWDLLLSDLEYRAEQNRRIRQEMVFHPLQIAFAGLTAGAALLVAAIGVVKVIGG